MLKKTTKRVQSVFKFLRNYFQLTKFTSADNFLKRKAYVRKKYLTLLTYSKDYPNCHHDK